MVSSQLICADSVVAMKDMADNSVDSIVTDPPYGLEFMGKDWDAPWKNAPAQPGDETFHTTDTPTGRSRVRYGLSSGYGGDLQKKMVAFQEWTYLWAKEAFRVLKPGGHILSFAGSRTYHRVASAIEDAGFEVRDQIMWLYGSGFPKSLNVGKALDKRGGESVAWFGQWLREWREENGIKQKEVAALFPSHTGNLTGCVANWEHGFNMPTAEQFNTICEHFDLPFSNLEEAEREIVGTKTTNKTVYQRIGEENESGEVDITLPASNPAKQWDGWGTALKPAHEPIVVARKPIEGTVAENVLEHGTGAINVDGCRIGTDEKLVAGGSLRTNSGDEREGAALGMFQDGTPNTYEQNQSGRFPANVILTHHPECVHIGIQEVKGSRIESSSDHTFNSGYGGGLGGPRPARGIGNADGMEVIEEWECHPDCPCKILDLQSGFSRSATPKMRHSPQGFGEGNVFGEGSITDRMAVEHGDSGTASRFFYHANITKQERAEMKPHHEPIVVARKPLEGTVAENVLEHGTGAINIDGTRIGHNEPIKTATRKQREAGWNTENCGFDSTNNDTASANPKGRFPANVILTHHSECKHEGIADERPETEVVEKWECHPDCPLRILDEQAPSVGNMMNAVRTKNTRGGTGHTLQRAHKTGETSGHFDGLGGASRFFYCAKPSQKERNAGCDHLPEKVYAPSNQAKAELKKGNEEFNAWDGKEHTERHNHNHVGSNRNNHPTVKPVDLMRYLCRLVTPPEGIVLDPFMGSGTTGIAANLEEFNFIGIDMEEEYVEIARARIAHSGDYVITEDLTMKRIKQPTLFDFFEEE